MPLPHTFPFLFDKYQDWLPGWAYRVKITLDATQIDSDLVWFPVLVHLSASCGQSSQDLTHIFDELGTESLKLAITKYDGLTELYVEVEKWDAANEEAWLWVSRDGWWIDSKWDTEFYLYYDKDHSDNSTYVGIPGSVPGEDVWDANFKLVTHMQDDPDTSHVIDSTDNNNDGTKKGANEPIEANSQVSKGQTGDGADDYIDYGSDSSIDLKATNFTVEVIMASVEAGNNKGPFWWASAGGGYIGAKAPHGGNHWPYLIIKDDVDPGEGYNWGTVDVHDGINHYLAFSVNWSLVIGVTVFVDEADVSGAGFGDLTIFTPANFTLIYFRSHTTLGNTELACTLDELRISDVIRVDAWKKATKHACWDELLTFDLLEEGMPGCIITISGLVVSVEKGSILVTLKLGERSTAEFNVLDLTGSTVYYQGQPVLIYDTSMTLIFGGVIDDPQISRIGNTVGRRHHIRCKDWHYLADKKIAAESYTSTLAGDIAKNLRLIYLNEEDVTDGVILNGPTILEAIVNYVRVSDALDALAEKANFVWIIDETKQLHFFERDTYVADWDATSEDIENAYISGKSPMYRNVQYLRGPTDITTEQTENHTGDNVMVAFPLGFPVAKVPTSIRENLGPPLDLGIKGVDVGKDWYWSKGDNNVYAEVAPGLGVAIEIKYFGEWNIITISQDNTEIAAQQAIEVDGSGKVEDIAFERGLTSKEAAFESNAAKLLKYSTNSRRFYYETTRRKLKPSMLQTITYSPANLSAAEMLIEEVIIHPLGRLVTYSITAIEGPAQGSWSNLFKHMADQANMIDKLTIGEESTVIILVQPNEAWTWGEADVETVFACPVVGPALFPGAALFPC